MKFSSTIRPAWTITRAMWSAQRMAFLGLLMAAFVCGLLFHWVRLVIQDPDGLDAVGYLPMGLSLFLTFVFCNFTESDRRDRCEGFPMRLFTLPVPTWLLVLAPVLFSIVTVGVIYAVWAKIALPVLGRELPWSWPSLYLAAGMTGYQAIVWTLARFRLARLLVLGVGGTVLAVGWDAFRDRFERELISGWLPIPENVPVRLVLCWLLVVLSFIALLVAYFAVETQRRGGSRERSGLRRWMEHLEDALPRRCRPFLSPARAQFWYEWRRHGIMLPLAVAGVLAVIMLPAFFREERLTAATTDMTLGWILLLPLLLAFALGKGFGKADLWSREPVRPVFFATLPLGNTGWIATKMQAAAVASLLAWLVVLILTPGWLWWGGDCQDLLDLGHILTVLYSPAVLWSAPILGFGVLAILTWRLLVDSLFVGFSGKTWMLTTAACGVFVVMLGTPMLALSWSLHPHAATNLLRLPTWLPWSLAGLFCAKVAIAFWLADRARQQGWITNRSILCYLALWLGATAFLVLAVWFLVPVAGWLRWLLELLSLFVMPLASVAYAPVVLGRSRQH